MIKKGQREELPWRTMKGMEWEYWVIANTKKETKATNFEGKAMKFSLKQEKISIFFF